MWINKLFSMTLVGKKDDVDDNGMPKKRMCARGDEGYTMKKKLYIIICKEVFQKMDASLVSRQKDQQKVAVGTSIKSQNIPGSVLLHEVMHGTSQRSK